MASHSLTKMEYYERKDQQLIHPAHSLLMQDEMLAIKYYRLSVTKIRLVSEYLGLAVPLLVTVCYSWVKNQRTLLELLSKHARLALLSYGGMLHVVRIETLLRLVRVRVADSLEQDGATTVRLDKEECVECEVLYDPGPLERSADVIFIHGIKGALTKTWRQGRWCRDTVKLQRLAPSRHTTTTTSTDKMMRDDDDAQRNSDDEVDDILSRLRDGQQILDNQEENNNRYSAGEDKMPNRTEDKEERSSCWPKDWLPLDCPSARVIAVNYTTDPNLWSPFWSSVPPRTTMTERAWEMIAKLTTIGVGEHPIVWVGHSKGGLYIKQMLVNASESRDERDRLVSLSTRGILFYSVPHRGSRLAKFNILPIILRRSVELTEVQDNCEEILNLDRKFRQLLEKDEMNVLIKSFVETSLTLMFIIYVRVVSLESAANDFGEIFGVHLDHRNICKPRNRHCFLYRELVDIIKCCQDVQRL